LVMHNPFKDIYYGWILVGALSLAKMTAWGVLYYSFSVFLTPMQQELGWSRSSMAGAFSVALLLSGLTGVPLGRWIDRHGPRWLMTAGAAMAALLVFAWGRVTDLTTFYLIWGGIGMTMAATLYEPAFAIIAKWFVRHRGRALTVLTFVAGFASVIYIPLAGWLIRMQGWRGALQILACLLAVGTIPLHALVLRRRPEDLGLAPDGDGSHLPETSSPTQFVTERSVSLDEALRGPTFWWLTTAFVMNTIGVIAINVHLVSYLIDHGFESSFAAAAMGLVGVMALPGRLIFTPLGDLVPRSLLTAFLFLLQTFSLLVLLWAKSKIGVLGFVALFGAGFGAITPARAALIAEYYGPVSYGGINGVLALFLTFAGALAPLGAAWGHDLAGSYAPVLWTLVATSALGAVSVLVAEQSARRLA
jgi:MFS family permease